jgi:drug/metabolite transporter (DMT)-like permease
MATGALVPAQLRMRGSYSYSPANNLIQVALPPRSPLFESESKNFKRLIPNQSALLKVTNYHPWKQRRSSSNRAGTFLCSQSQESPDGEEAIVELNIDAPLHLMEKGFNRTNYNLTADSSASLELWGMPIQSIILLNLVAVIWGTQHAVIKGVVDESAMGQGTGFITWIENVGIKSIQPSIVSSGNSVGGDSTAAYFTLARFGLAAILASPYTPGWGLIVNGTQKKLGFIDPKTTGGKLDGMTHDDPIPSEQKRSNNQNTIATAWKYGAELGLYMFLGYAFQAIGLETTTASRSGFLLYLNVKLVPFFSYFIFGKRIPRRTWISALVAFGGTALLALDDANAVGSAEKGLGVAITAGDLWSIAAAAASAMFILRMEAASKAVPKSSELNAATLWTVAALSFLWTMVISLNNLSDTEASAGTTTVFAHVTQHTFQETISTISRHLLPLIYLSGVTTALANFLQSKAQKDISAERASVIYAMDPVYGAIFANILLGETLGDIGLVGAFLILVAAAANAVFDFGSVSGYQAVEDVSGSGKEKI